MTRRPATMGPSCPASLGRRTAAVGIVTLRVILVTVMFQAIAANTEHMACPTDCFCLGNMVDCSKKRLKRVPDDLPSWVQILDISSNGITHVRNDQFKGLDQLEEINLSDNKLTIFNGSVLRHLPTVRNLKLSHNQLRQVPDVSWPVNITHLILSHNVISHVNGSSLRKQENLRVIDLSYNAITQLRNATLAGLNGLHHLFLMDNKIESIDRGALDNLSSLEWLKLSKNRLTSLPQNVFVRLQKLKYLEINQNRLKRIEGLRFQGLGNLVSLRLRRNQLSELMDGAFWGLSRIETLQLDYNNLSRINSGFLFGLETMEHLSMAHNVINQIEADSWSSCKRLTELDLSHNHLSAITESMFWRLETLQTLKLNQNRISYIAETAFRDLLALKTLDLNHNELSSALEDTNSVFSSLTSLTRFSLDANNIKSIAKHTFKGLHHLKQLNLLANSITSIQDNAFEPLKDLEQLRFNSTSLLCDCHLSWLPIWLRGTGQQMNVVAQCAHPAVVQGQSVLDVDGGSFKCDDFPKPIIIKDPQSQIALKDGTLNLTCTAATSSDSQLKIDWKKDHVVLSNALVENTARSSNNEDGGLVEYTSHLVLRPVKNEHSGHYQCIVSNALGTSYSAKAEITVGVFPRFLKTPSDVTVKAGSTARLECAASGQPTPEIAWQKDGGDDFPAARERRMHVMPSDDVFFIVEVKSEDQGVYTCTAKNDAGSVKANSTLVVLRAPSFTKTSREKVATEGETAVLECMSSRIGGRPRLDWLKEGQPLFVTSRHYFAAEGQLLVIVNAQPSDSGEYTCIMTNSLGSERATSHFTVVGLSSFGDKSYVAESNQGDDMTRVGIIVIAVVVCVVGTSLVWVIVIYRLRLKREEYGSTTTDETTLPGEIPSSPFHANEDGSSITGHRSSPVLWTNAGHSVTAEDYSSVMRGTKRLLSDPTQKCSPNADFYVYNSCRCHQDSGCFCTDSNKSNEKSSHSHLPEVGNEADRVRKYRLPPGIDCRRHSTVSMSDVGKDANVRASIKEACRSLEAFRQVAEDPPPSTGTVCINTCAGWHVVSDSDLSSAGNQRHLCTNKYPVSCQKREEGQVAMPCHLHDKRRTFENCWHTLGPPLGPPGGATVNRSCQSDCLHKQLAEALPAVVGDH